jgi:hypothetical protein
MIHTSFTTTFMQPTTFLVPHSLACPSTPAGKGDKKTAGEGARRY